jgi:hypothetical protein
VRIAAGLLCPVTGPLLSPMLAAAAMSLNHNKTSNQKVENQMTDDKLSRRMILIGGAATLAASPLKALAQGAGPAIHVLKDPNCGCCSAWIEILENDGFAVTTERSLGTLLMRYKLDNGIPQDMVSCHTARVDGYMIEGHVPVADIRRLLEERPAAVGLAVPGMPYGSPGMGPESDREAYDVVLIRRDGSTEVFTRYAAA